jgi:hypothetical protein
MTTLTQIPIGSAPYGMSPRYVAFLEASPEQFSNSLGITFERVRDDLDDLDAAQIRTNSGVYALLGFYINAPKKGLFICISEKSHNRAQDLDQVLEAISSAGANVLWKDPSL